MIKAPAKARPKPRPKKPPTSKQDDANEGDGGPAGAEKATKDAKPPKPKRRRPPPKKKDVDSDGADGLHKDRAEERKHKLSSHLQFLHGQDDHRYYERAPRLLPEIPGVKSLSLTEINSDIKHIQSALNVFEAKVTALLPPGSNHHGKHRVDIFDDNDDEESIDMAYGFKPRRARPNGVITPEEVVESLPICRRAVRITQRELAVMKRERDDLERDFMRLRCKYVYHVSEMKKMQKQQDRITRVLSRDVVKIAKSLESSRRRTNALQDIMTELETRGSNIIRLTREKHQLETILKKNEITLPEIEEVYVGDRVECLLGKGQVLSMDEDTRILVVDMDRGGRAYVQESEVEVLPAEVTYLDVEKELKQTFFEKIGALVQPNGRFGSRRHGRNTSGDLELSGGAGENAMYDGDSGDDNDDDDDDDEESDEDDDDNDSGKNANSDADLPKQKKRKLMMMTASNSSSSALKKKQKYQRVIDYPACTIPITPYETGLLLSPLSTLPDRVAAVGPNALQWKDSFLPSRMHEWEQERYESLQMKGEIERLRFQLHRAEAEKLDAQQHASDQLESINQLVAQLDKLRDTTSASFNGGNLQLSNSSNSVNNQCPTCSNGTGNASRKNSSSSVKTIKSSAKSSHKKDAGKRQHGESSLSNAVPIVAAYEYLMSLCCACCIPLDPDDDTQEASTDEKNDNKAKNDSPEEEGDDGVDHDSKEGKDADHDDVDAGAESSDGASSKPTTRSLRPRRKPTSNSTTASPKQSK